MSESEDNDTIVPPRLRALIRSHLRELNKKSRTGSLGHLNDAARYFNTPSQVLNEPLKGKMSSVQERIERIEKELAELKAVESGDKIEVNGYEAEFCDGYVKFGCAEIDNDLFYELKAFLEDCNLAGRGNRIVDAVRVGDGEFDEATIYKICERLK